VYVLQAHEEKFPIDSLADLGKRLKVPEGWRFRSQILTEDLILDLKSDQTIYAVGDEYHQYWTRIPQSKVILGSSSFGNSTLALNQMSD
jgi:hypothetical protein